MRAWLLVLAVLATFHKVTEVASTEQVSSSSSSSSTHQTKSSEHLTDSYSSSITSTEASLDRSRRNTFIIDSSISSNSNNNINRDSSDIITNNSHTTNNDSNTRIISEQKSTTSEHNQSTESTTTNTPTKTTTNNSENSVNSNLKSNNNNNDNDNEVDIDDDYDDEMEDEEEEDTETEQRQRPSAEQLVEIEKNLLSLFGFSKRPKIDRSKIVIPDAMRQLYQQITGHNLDAELNLPKRGANGDLHLKNANTVRSFTHEESEIDNRFKNHHRFRLYFNVSSIPKSDKLRVAELTLHRNAYTSEADRDLRHQVLVYDIVRPGIRGKREPILLLINSKSVKISGNGTLQIDITSAVERWLKVPKHNHGILVHVTSSHDDSSSVPAHKHIRLRRSIDEESHEQWHHKQPLLMAYSDDARHQKRPARDAAHEKGSQPNRNRRTPGGRRRKPSMRNSCQRWPLYVDFADVGWSDWIVAPPGYEAFYCAGECQFPIADHLNTTNHAIVQTLVNSISPSLVPKACCVPTHLSSICMLYLDDSNKVVLKNYQDMTVVGCGCR